MEPLQTFTGLALMPPTGLNFGQAFKDASRIGQVFKEARQVALQVGAIAAQNALLSKQMVATLTQPPCVGVAALMGTITPLAATLEMLKASRLPIGDLAGLSVLAQISRTTNFYGTFITPPFISNQSVTTQDTNQ